MNNCKLLAFKNSLVIVFNLTILVSQLERTKVAGTQGLGAGNSSVCSRITTTLYLYHLLQLVPRGA